MTQTLYDRLQYPDVIDLPDWQAADVLNQPDTTQTVIVYWVDTNAGPGTIMDTLGPITGADLLDSLDASTDPVIRWGMDVLRSGKLDIAKQSTREVLDAMTVQGAITPAQRDELFALSKRERYPSWAEANNTVVNASTVGIARAEGA
jgi:hypothetical protein